MRQEKKGKLERKRMKCIEKDMGKGYTRVTATDTEEEKGTKLMSKDEDED